MTLVRTALNLGEKMKIYPQVLTLFIKPQIWLFHVVVLLTTAKKWTKVENARAGRAKLLFLSTKYANLWRSRCRRRCRCLSSLIESWGRIQTPLQSCAEDNWVKSDFRATLARHLIQTAQCVSSLINLYFTREKERALAIFSSHNLTFKMVALKESIALIRVLKKKLKHFERLN